MQMLMPEPQIFVERTLALIKPDIVDKEEEIEDLILRSGFLIVQKRKLQLSPEQCSNFYADQYGKVFFPNLTAYMSSGPLVAMVLARHCAVSYWKELLGPSNSIKARRTHPHSLRAIYGTDDLRNALHGSVSIFSAEREIRFMFPEVILEPVPAGQRARDYLNLYVKPTLLAGLTALCKEKPADPMIWLADWLIEHNPNKPRVQHQITEEEHQGHKKVYFSQGLMLSFNICLKERCLMGTAHLKGVFCVLLLLKVMLISREDTFIPWVPP
ncbi:unnamed protein product [Bubo scandiacus]